MASIQDDSSSNEIADKKDPFEVGDILRHRSKSGPSILYIGKGRGEYFNREDQPCVLDVNDIRFERISPIHI